MRNPQPLTSRGEWMQTFTGREFYPVGPAVDDIDPTDIAHALSMICRYGGHTKVFYSVAEHCVLMSYAVSPENAPWALLHDGTEAYVGDVIRPLKDMMPDYRLAEARLSDVIADRFGLPRRCPREVKEADLRILLDERLAVMSKSPRPWSSLTGVTRLGVTVTGWCPEYAEKQYLARLQELGLHS